MNQDRLILAFAQRFPRRVIEGERGPYLSRYTLAEMPDGGHVYLHFFHRGDADRELHNHPWAGTSVILTGGYREERRGEGDGIDVRVYGPGDVNHLAPDTFHRVDLIDEARGCWTLFVTSARVQSWGFWCRETRVFTPWREALARRGLVPVNSISEAPR
ncbi:MAG TPA: hypothetical protein VLS49_01170 [Usitatibacter sp.]|nr:hypothetical protein [Usitatibacter sp.]